MRSPSLDHSSNETSKYGEERRHEDDRWSPETDDPFGDTELYQEEDDRPHTNHSRC